MVKNENVDTKVNSVVVSKSLFSRFISWIKNNPVEFYIIVTLVPAFIFGFVMGVHQTGSVGSLFNNMHIMHTNNITKSIEFFGFGTALFNASGIALFYYLYGKLTKVEWTASPFMSIMLVFGFSFLILNFYAILFLLAGIVVTSLMFRTSFDKSYGAATLSTSLTPIFSYLVFSQHSVVPQYGGILLGGFIMMLTTMMAQKIGGLVAKINDGLTLANTGVSHGFLAIFFYTLLMISGLATNTTTDNELFTVLYPENQWYLMVYMGTVSTFIFVLYCILFPKNKGFMDVIKKDGKAPTDWFVVSGVREAAFNIWAFMMLSIALNGIWSGITDAEFGMNSLVCVSFIQVFGFSAFGHNLIGALIMTLGFYVAWEFTLAAGPNSGGPFGSIWAGGWVAQDYMSLVMFGWLLTPMMGINIFAPFVAAIFHVAWQRMFVTITGGFTYYVHGISTFMSVVFLLPFFQSINWLRKPSQGPMFADLSIAEANRKLERNKVVAMSTELLYYLSDEGATDISTKFTFGKASSKLTVVMSKGKAKVLEDLAAQLNDFKRDRVMEYNMWASLGTEATTRNIALLAQMTDSAKLTKDGSIYTLVLTRKRIKLEKEN